MVGYTTLGQGLYICDMYVMCITTLSLVHLAFPRVLPPLAMPFPSLSLSPVPAEDRVSLPPTLSFLP
jgi:hypothetical protein